MNILVIDGQGGNLGRQIVKLISERFPEDEIIAVGTNSAATTNMLKAASIKAATGENAVRVACGKADVIIGPIGIIAADALLGEVTGEIARWVGSSHAVKILIPMAKCGIIVAGLSQTNTSLLLEDAMEKLAQLKSASSGA